MIQTKKLYDLDAYATEFEAVVTSCEIREEKEQKIYEVVLDQTLFFPEEGGQTPDQGRIQEATVLDVQVKDGVITHTVDAPLAVGEQVHGTIDWKHRFNNMQQHSGEHIFSGLVHERFGYDNVGFHLSNQIVSMDFNGMITPEEAAEIEYAANEAIIRNLPIEVSFPSKEELEKLDYRSKIEIEGKVRIITIPGIDVCACCAPHVRYTGEIGLLKIVSMQNYKGGIRICILCGFRALNDYRQKTEIIGKLGTDFSANQDTVLEAIGKLKETNQSLKEEMIAAKQECMEVKLNGISAEEKNVILFERNLDPQVMRNAVNSLVTKHSGICGIFSEEGNGYRFIIGSEQTDLRPVMTTLKEHFGAKGGGSPKMIQGSMEATREAILDILK